MPRSWASQWVRRAAKVTSTRFYWVGQGGVLTPSDDALVRERSAAASYARAARQRGSDSLVLLVPPRHMSIADLDIMRDVGIQGHISARASIRITSTCSWGLAATRLLPGAASGAR